MDVPPPKELIELVRALPAAQPLFERLGDAPGVHLVGGAVRDILLGRRPEELDLVVEGDPAPLAARLGGPLRVHDRFGTSTVMLDERTFDIARARRESYSRPGALPDVVPATLEQDLRRRDFTVNAGAITLTGARAGELQHIPPMLADLDHRLLRVLHDRSFLDDPTRLLRLARYGARLGFAVEPHTRALLDEAVREGALMTVSASRIGTELRLLAREPDAVAALACLHQLGLDRALSLDGGKRVVEQARRALALLPAGERRDRLLLAAATRALPREQLGSRLGELAFEAADRDAIVTAASGAGALAGALRNARLPSEIAAAASGAPAELVALAGAQSCEGLDGPDGPHGLDGADGPDCADGPDGPEANAREWLEHLRHVRLEIDGEDLLAAGVPRGPAIGRGLRAALAEKLDGRVRGREQELAAAVRAARSDASG